MSTFKQRLLWSLQAIFLLSFIYLFYQQSNQTSTQYNILDYGAQANRPSFDNAKIINHLIQKIGKNGGTIYIPEGDFYISTPIVIDRSYVTIMGSNSGLSSGVDKGNDKSQSGGGGARLLVSSGITGIELKDTDNSQRLSGITLRHFQIKGEGNNGIGIHGNHDSDRIIIDDLVITNVGTGIQLRGADAAVITHSWIAETKSSIVLDGASQQAQISNNALGAQPQGITIHMENPRWANITGNNIFPNGATAIRLENAHQTVISANTISAYFTGIIELMPNSNNERGQHNLISNNVISLEKYQSHPEGRNINWGIAHINADNTLFSNNQIVAKGIYKDFTAIQVEAGNINRIDHNNITSTVPSNRLVEISASANDTTVLNTVANDTINDSGSRTKFVPLP
ncbi:right-handed parallel beta-helix repeat-containing protein [Aerococcaceae bacterium zg-BR9]|uniref:NosD domain-containing protein n=1 Tax=Aerococcaceae bacterium zg-1292 TaxID=2774330 RepID=UPI004063FB84|nr:right-handed parallel beta-helix repeat-containing protein [Aerococcaceae bacterium zg-BR9]